MSVWTNIAHAPKDGTAVDLWMKKPGGGYRLPNCHYQVSEIWSREGWFVEPAAGGGFWLNDSFGVATHFMPVPKGPNVLAGKDGQA
ncbi:MAG TPA: hypothetical protein VN579_04450 [Bryobacteraceae bacterium]|nr:hypothetical protein [Bryobacteraceae bacterium]